MTNTKGDKANEKIAKNGKDAKDSAKDPGRKRKRDRANDLIADQGPVVGAVAAVALVLGAGLGVLLFGATRKRAGGGDVPGNAALGGGATGEMSSLAGDGALAGASENEAGIDAGDWYATREGAGGAEPVLTPAASVASGAASEEGEHVPTDLDPDVPRPERAVEAFRPDRDAPPLPAERDAFAPATKPVPSRVEAMGNGDED